MNYQQPWNQGYSQSCSQDNYSGFAVPNEITPVTGQPPYGQNRQYPGRQTQWNPNSVEFVPNQRQQFYNNGYQRSQQDHFPPPYANAPMYGQASYNAPHNYKPYMATSAPSVTHFYSENEDEMAAYIMMEQYPMPQQYMPSHELHQMMTKQSGPFMPLIHEIQVGLEQLVSETGMEDFDSWAEAIRDRLKNASMTDEGRHIAIYMLCEMAVALSPSIYRQGPQPQQTMARLLKYLAFEIAGLNRATVLVVLKTLHDDRASYDVERRNNLITFFAHCYCNVLNEQEQRLELLGEKVLDQLEDYVKPEGASDATVKTVMTVMKLCGRFWDSIPKSRERVDQLLTRLTAFRHHPQISESVKTELNDLFELRQSGWNCRSAASSVGSAQSGAIIGADGQTLDLSEEERLFLENHFGALEDGNPSDTSLDDAEVMNDFGEFVAEEQRANDVKKTEEMLDKLKVCEDSTTPEPPKDGDTPTPQ